MAEYQKCYRCGNYYPENTEHKPIDKIKGEVVCGVSTVITGLNMDYDKYYNLCDDCISNLFKFLNNER